MNKIEYRNFNCPILGGVARIKITHHYLEADQLPQPTLTHSAFTDCANKLQCGIRFHRSAQSIGFKWQCCPAHPDYDPSEPLP